MKEKEKPTEYDFDLFDFIDILASRKLVVLSFLAAAVFFASIYCFVLRPEAKTRYVIQAGIRYPHTGDMLSKDPGNPDTNINIGGTVSSICSKGILRGDLQKRFELKDVPDISVSEVGSSVPLLLVSIKYPEEDKGKRILHEIVTLIKENQVLREMMKKEKQALLSNIRLHLLEKKAIEQKISKLKDEMNSITGLIADNRNMASSVLKLKPRIDADNQIIELFERQQVQWKMSRSMLSELMNRFIMDEKQKKDAIDELEIKLDNLETAFQAEGAISSKLVQRKRISDTRILMISGIVGLALGIFFAFILEIRTRRSSAK